MKTLTVAEARKDLRKWLRLAAAGEEIGIIYGNKIVALRPVTVTAIDFEEIPMTAAIQRKMDSIAKTPKRAKK